MATFEVTVVQQLEATYIVTVEAETAEAAHRDIHKALFLDGDAVEDFDTVRKVGIDEWVSEEITQVEEV